jgi:colanic acid/amylovoran biosynthesis glycosyltransferase
MKSQTKNIGHYHPVWLPSTMTWLYNQINALNSHTNNHIICELTENLNQFDINHLHVFSRQNRITRLEQRITRYLGLSPSLRYYIDVLKENKCQLVHSHFGHIAVEGSKIAQHLGVPHVTSFYGMDVNQLPNLYPDLRKKYLHMFERTDLVLCEGPFMANSIVDLGCPSNKIKIHPLGVYLDKLPFQIRNSEEYLKILISASFRQKKGIPLALEAIAKIKDKYPLRVTIVGDAGIDTASLREKKNILDTITKNNLVDEVEMLGMLKFDELKEVAKDHHIFLSPSIHASDGDCEGGAPLSLIEMGAMGLINVSSKHCDIPKVVLDEKTGFLAEEDNLDSLINTLEKAIASRSQWDIISSASRKHMENHFDATVQSVNLYKLYIELIDG